MGFEHSLTARFYEIDRAGIVFFGRFFEYCHAAYEEMFVAAFGGLEDIFRRADWGTPLVHAEADFTRPVRLGDRLKVVVGVERLTERSVTFVYEVLGEDRSPRAKLRTVHAFIDPKTFKPRSAPPEFREGLARVGVSVPD